MDKLKKFHEDKIRCFKDYVLWDNFKSDVFFDLMEENFLIHLTMRDCKKVHDYVFRNKYFESINKNLMDIGQSKAIYDIKPAQAQFPFQFSRQNSDYGD